MAGRDEALEKLGEKIAFLYDWGSRQSSDSVRNPKNERQKRYASEIAGLDPYDCYMAGAQMGMEIILHDLFVFLQEGNLVKLLMELDDGSYFDTSVDEDVELNVKIMDWLEEKSQYKTQMSILFRDD